MIIDLLVRRLGGNRHTYPVIWEGQDEEDAARRYVEQHRDCEVIATRRLYSLGWVWGPPACAECGAPTYFDTLVLPDGRRLPLCRPHLQRRRRAAGGDHETLQ